MSLIRVGDVALWVATFSACLFVVMYHFSARWWKSEEGWHIMSFTAAIAAVFLYLTVTTTVRSGPSSLPVALQWTRLVIYATFAGLLLWRLSMVTRAQRRHQFVPDYTPSEQPPVDYQQDRREKP